MPDSQFLFKKMAKNSIIQDKSLDFSVRIVRLCRYLENERREFVISKQILRSGTSVGANVRESRNAQSDADFISKLSISLKEADETQFWLEVLYRSETIDEKMYKSLCDDVKELVALLTSIIKTMKSKKTQNE